MAMVMLYTPYDVGGYNEYRNLYYLDTLLTGNSDYLIPNNDSVSRQVNAFITFDFDGNVTEQHFVRVGFTDTLGNDLTPRFMGNSHLVCLSTSLLSGENFNIDSEGNIYVIRSVHADEKSGRCDTCPDRRRYWRLWEGTIMRFFQGSLSQACAAMPLGRTISRRLTEGVITLYSYKQHIY